MSGTIGVSTFVQRQTEFSKFSYFDGSWDELAALVKTYFDLGNYGPGYRDGVVLVTVPPQGFYSGVIQVTPHTVLEAKFDARRKGEAPFIHVEAVAGRKTPAEMVEIVLYRADVLAENNERSTDDDWEIISINARPTVEAEPMTPMAMARNFLGLPGGTQATYTAQQFAEAIVYWSTRTFLADWTFLASE